MRIRVSILLANAYLLHRAQLSYSGLVALVYISLPTLLLQIIGFSYNWEGAVEPGVWRRNFAGVLAYKFWWSELLQGPTAVGNMQMNFDLSTGQS